MCLICLWFSTWWCLKGLRAFMTLHSVWKFRQTSLSFYIYIYFFFNMSVVSSNSTQQLSGWMVWDQSRVELTNEHQIVLFKAPRQVFSEWHGLVQHSKWGCFFFSLLQNCSFSSSFQQRVSWMGETVAAVMFSYQSSSLKCFCRTLFVLRLIMCSSILKFNSFDD